MNDFILPDGPFYGPQEALASVLSAGDSVEEWIYRRNGETQYVWFWGEPEVDEADWTVLMTATYPEDAVYEGRP